MIVRTVAKTDLPSIVTGAHLPINDTNHDQRQQRRLVHQFDEATAGVDDCGLEKVVSTDEPHLLEDTLCPCHSRPINRPRRHTLELRLDEAGSHLSLSEQLVLRRVA